jgi:hypothetical protein
MQTRRLGDLSERGDTGSHSDGECAEVMNAEAASRLGRRGTYGETEQINFKE